MKKKYIKLIVLASLLAMQKNILVSEAFPEIIYKNFTMNEKKISLPIADVLVDNEPLTGKNAGIDPVIINSRTLLPIRFLSEKMGFAVSWENKTQKVTISKEDKKIEMFVGKDKVIIGGVSQKMTDSVPPVIINNKTMVPIRFVVEQMGMDIEYDAKKNQVTLDTLKEESLLFANNEQENSGQESILAKEQPQKNQKDDGKAVSETVKKEEKINVENKPLPAVPEVYENSQNERQNVTYENKNRLYYQETQGNIEKIFEISSTGQIENSHFYLSEPSRLVIDIKSSVLETNQEQTKIFMDTFFTKLDSAYHPADDYTRMVLYLQENVNSKDITVAKENNKIVIKYVKDVSQNLKTNFNRMTGTVAIELSKPYKLENMGEDVDIIIPKENLQFLAGNISVENNFLYSLDVTEDEINYYLKGVLKERVNINLEQTSEKTWKINFSKAISSRPKIIIDPGHGGKDPGAINKTYGVNEKTLNLNVGLKVYESLKNAGYDVYMTRDNDTFVGLNDIAKIANDHNADIFISLHHNSAGPSAKGIESYYYVDEESKRLAQKIQEKMIQQTGAQNRGVKSAGYVVIKKTYMPAVLLELGFVSNNQEMFLNNSPQYQDKLALAITQGVNEYFNR